MGKPVFINAGFPGVGAIARHGEQEGLWNLVDISKTQNIPLNEQNYIFGAFSPVYSRIIQNLSEDTHVSILFSSSVGEIDLEPVEQQYLRTIINSPRINNVLFGDKTLANLVDKGKHFPYPVSTQLVKNNSEESEPMELRGDPAITLLNPSTKKKNALNQLTSTTYLNKNPVIHTVMDDYEDILIDLDIPFETHDWLEGNDYWGVLKSSDLNLCVSWAETFSYQTFEAAWVQTPVLASTTVDWLPPVNRNPFSNMPMKIGEHAQLVIDENRTVSKRYLEEVARKRTNNAKQTLNNMYNNKSM